MIKLRYLMVLSLLSLSAMLWGQAIWIHAKARLAQQLIHRAWEKTLADPDHYRQHPPWSWADTWPVARLQWLHAETAFGVIQVQADYFVLAGAHGSALAFGPGNVDGTALPGFGASVIGGHRDTHFSFLREVSSGDMFRIQTLSGQWKIYRVVNTSIADVRQGNLVFESAQDALWLITCYPFNALVPGGPLRYVVHAEFHPDHNLTAL